MFISSTDSLAKLGYIAHFKLGKSLILKPWDLICCSSWSIISYVGARNKHLLSLFSYNHFKDRMAIYKKEYCKSKPDEVKRIVLPS